MGQALGVSATTEAIPSDFTPSASIWYTVERNSKGREKIARKA